MKWLVSIVIAAMFTAAAGHVFDIPIMTFTAAAAALLFLSKILGDAAEQLSRYVGQKVAGLVNVTLSNLSELIIIFVAVRANMLELVKADIVGAMIGNLLLVMGVSIYVGCRKHGTMHFNPDTATLLVNQLFLVGTTLLLPSLFADRIHADRQGAFSYLLALMLVGAYVYYYVLSLTDRRFAEIKSQGEQLNHRWTRRATLLIMLSAAVSIFFMSELLVGEVETVARGLSLSPIFIGFILLPLLGNLAENGVAIFAAHKGLSELSLSVAVGSASQVGMIIAPCAVLFGVLTGNPFTLDFRGLPLDVLALSLIGAYIVLRDNRWNINEGVMLIALYVAMVTAFAFCQ